MQRFVILRHQPGEASDRELHWDLMLEGESSLRTWALDSEPALEASATAVELPEHRKDYLDYEGLVSGRRGSVTRFDRGTYSVVRESNEELVLQLNGERLQAAAIMQRGEDQRWRVAFAAG